MKPLKKNDRLIDVANQTEWTFDCKTRGPDIANGPEKPIATWTCVVYNKQGHRRFISEAKMAEVFETREA
jgi:hypothetical protein